MRSIRIGRLMVGKGGGGSTGKVQLGKIQAGGIDLPFIFVGITFLTHLTCYLTTINLLLFLNIYE